MVESASIVKTTVSDSQGQSVFLSVASKTVESTKIVTPVINYVYDVTYTWSFALIVGTHEVIGVLREGKISFYSQHSKHISIF